MADRIITKRRENMKEIDSEFKTFLCKEGASLVGFADMSCIPESKLPIGVAIAVKLPADIVLGIHDGPTKAYYEAYFALNEKLNQIVSRGATFLKGHGYEALAQTTTAVHNNEEHRTVLPHKTVATRAGLGWIGKSALLVTEVFGPAVRLSSILTNAPLRCDEPITVSRCGSCNECTIACPSQAISGKIWKVGMDRDEFFNSYACREKARQIAKEKVGKEITLCGKCFEVCPYASKYLNT